MYIDMLLPVSGNGTSESVWDLTESVGTCLGDILRCKLDEVVEASADVVHCPATKKNSLPSSSRRFCILPTWLEGLGWGWGGRQRWGMKV